MTTELAWQEAYKWLCHQRKSAPADSDVWHLRFHWAADGAAFRERVEQGKYRLKPMRVVNRVADEPVAMWDADDALVLKWAALQIQEDMPVHPKCHHVKGTGVHYSRREVKNALDSGEYRFIYRTDIRGYYQHMQKDQLNALVGKWVKDPVLLDLTKQYIAYSVEDGGEFHTPVNGISRGCALSPLIGAGLLFHIDELFEEKKDLFYVRYMDDFLVLSKKRWPLRRAVRALNEQINVGGFYLHPDKTQIGRVEKGFDWLGLWFDGQRVRRSPRSLQMRANKIRRLYERLRTAAGRSLFVCHKNRSILGGIVAIVLAQFASGPVLAVTLDFGEVILDHRYWDVRSASARLDGIKAVDSDVTLTSLLPRAPTGESVCSEVLNGFAYNAPQLLARSTSRLPWGLPLAVDSSDLSDGASLYLGGGDSDCTGRSIKFGPFTESVGTISQLDVTTGVVVWSDVVNVSGTSVNRGCDLPTTSTQSFGDLYTRAAGSVLGTMSFRLGVQCYRNLPPSTYPSVAFTSYDRDGDVFIPVEPTGVGVILETSNGARIAPGNLVGLSDVQQLTATAIQTASSSTPGDFSIVIDVSLYYP